LITPNNPLLPNNTCTWDVSIVLNWLEKCFSLQNLPLKELTMKLVALLALSTAQRVQVLKMLKINMLSVFGDYVINIPCACIFWSWWFYDKNTLHKS
jgi:hypothetical protein